MFDVPLTLGVEEEYQIIDPKTRELTSYAQQIIGAGEVLLGNQVKQEFMQSQIEVGSVICENIDEVRSEVYRLRKSVSDLAREHGREIVAASTHPFSRWQDQDISEYDRYKDLEARMQMIGYRLLIFGMHVHVGFGKSPEALELIIDIQNQARYFLPHILALTTSSPFWQGRNTGLKSYRSIIFENVPRSGIPPIMNSFSEYESYLKLLHTVGQMPSRADGSPDYTMIRWDSRPQEHFGTLEFRVSDICTKPEEAICIAALIQAVCAKLVKLRSQNQNWRIYRSELIAENKWLAVRYGIDGKLIDFGKAEAVAARTLAKELVDFVDDVVDELGCRKEVEYVYTILEQGTSADRQLFTYNNAVSEGATKSDALQAVVDQLIIETVEGI